jgi:ubiquinone biosynthesis protein UbiJ
MQQQQQQTLANQLEEESRLQEGSKRANVQERVVRIRGRLEEIQRKINNLENEQTQLDLG